MPAKVNRAQRKETCDECHEERKESPPPHCRVDLTVMKLEGGPQELVREVCWQRRPASRRFRNDMSSGKRHNMLTARANAKELRMLQRNLTPKVG